MITALCLLLSAMMMVTPAPRDEITANMILMEVAENGSLSRSSGINWHGQCKRFQLDTFAKASVGYRLAQYPDAVLFLPMEHAPTDVTGRPVGSCWDMPDPAEGNGFVEAARFDYDMQLSRKENEAIALDFLSTARAGDVLQMLARYSSGGRGTHTIMFTRPYDPRSGTLYWSDSNFANTMVDGVRHGYVRAYQSWPVDEVVSWLTKDGNNGATLYRISEDVVRVE